MIQSLLPYWIGIAVVCAIAGLLVYPKNPMAGLLLGAIFGPIGLVVAAIGNVSATLEEMNMRQGSTLSAAPRVGYEPVAPVKADRVACQKCHETFPRGMVNCPHCGAKARTFV